MSSSEGKSNREIAADITIAWIKAKSDNTVAGTGGSADRGVPTENEVSEFYKTVFKAVINPNT